MIFARAIKSLSRPVLHSRVVSSPQQCLKPSFSVFRRSFSIVDTMKKEIEETLEDKEDSSISELLEKAETSFKVEREDANGDVWFINKNVKVQLKSSELEHSDEDESAVPFLVFITGNNNLQMTVSCNARLDNDTEDGEAEVEIEDMAIEKADKDSPEIEEDSYSPRIGELDEEVSESIFDYLADKGVNDEFASALVDIAGLKEMDLYLKWLNDVKDFTQKDLN